MTADARGVSTVLGGVLMVGVAVLVASGIGVFLASQTVAEVSTEPLVDLTVEGDGSTVTLTHDGGDPLVLADVTVILRDDGTTQRVPLESTAEPSGDGDGRFEPGERRRLTTSLAGPTLQVIVVHEPENAVLRSRTIDLSGGP